MYLYRLHRSPSDNDSEGEDWDQWFGSLAAARKRRQECITEMLTGGLASMRFESDFQIDQVTLAKLPPRKLALAILNRHGWIGRSEEVEPAWMAPKVDWCATCQGSGFVGLDVCDECHGHGFTRRAETVIDSFGGMEDNHDN